MKLNLGSGNCPLGDGWLNLDGKTGDSLYPLFKYQGDGKSSGFDSDCASEIRASHCLEHFSHHQTLSILKEWVRVLKPGGWLKIAVPDFDWIACASQEFRERMPIVEGYLFGGQIDENDYHKALFTNKKLYELLQACGLVNIQSWTSEIQDCASLPVSLNLMGQKPEAKTDPSEDLTARMWANTKPPDSYYGRLYEEETKCSGCGIKPDSIKLTGSQRAVSSCKVCSNPTAWTGIPAVDEDRVHKVELRKAPPSRTQVFAAGRWQDLEGEVQCATQEELEAAQRGELQTRTIVSDGSRAAKIALCLSTPRQGFLRPFERLLALAHQANISVFSGDGVFWHHALSRSIRNAIEFDFEDGSDGFDFILTADYDTYAVIEDIKALAELLARSPEADCIVPMQMKRGGTGEILAGGRNMNLTHSLVPIETGHFGLTIFRKSFFERLPLPWFYEKPDAEGHWGDGRTDADIGFWLNAKKAKLSVMLAPGIVAGHGEELITYPRIVNGKAEKVYQAVNDWLNVRTKPEGIGVQ